MNNKKLLSIMVLVIGLCVPLRSNAQLNRVTGVSISEKKSITTVTIRSENKPQYRYFPLGGTEIGIVRKIVVDIEGASHSIEKPVMTEPVGPVARIRSSQWREDPPIVRVVTDLRVNTILEVVRGNGDIILTFSNYTTIPPPVDIIPPVVPKLRDEIYSEEQKLQKIKLNLKGATIGQAIELFQRVYAMNILVAKSVNRNDKLDIHLTDAFEKENLLESILIANEYKFVKRQNIYIILGQNVKIADEMRLEIFKLEYIDANDIIDNLKAIGSEDGDIQVVIRTPIGKTAAVAAAGVKGISRGAGGISEEANPLQGLENINEEGTDQGHSDILTVVDRPAVIEKMRIVIEELDKPVPQVHISVMVVETLLGESEKWGLNWRAIMEAAPSARGEQQNKPGTKPADGTSENAASETEVNGAGLPLKIGDFRAGTLSMEQYENVLNMLKRREDSKLLNQPSITTLHNQQATIAVGASIPVEVKQIGLDVSGGAVTTILDQNIAAVFSMIPQVNENKYITLWVNPVIREITGFTGKNNDLPVTSSRTAETRMRVKSGDVVIIGGLIKEDIIKTVSKVKYFSSLPFIGRLFTKTKLDRERSELVIFFAPEIANPD